MKTEQLLSKWHKLPEDKQQEVMDFVEFLESLHWMSTFCQGNMAHKILR